MKELFSYKNEIEAGSAEKILLIHLSERFAGVCVTNRDSSVLYFVSFFCADPGDQINLQTFREKSGIANEQFSRVSVSLNYESYDFPVQPSLSIHIPKETESWINTYYPGTHYIDQHTVICKNIPGDGLYADFKTDEFSVVLIKNNQLQLATNLDYETPADLIWHFLNIGHHFSISQQDMMIKLSGFLEKDSALYKELHQYFLHIDFEDAGWGIAGDYPAHYFTTFNRLAKCEL